jgi:hypothetical protein
MKTTFLQRLGIGVVGLALAGACLVSIHAQSGSAATANRTTNWLGYVVVGMDAPDLVEHGPYPRAERGVQIGLRSDGVVVWRKTPK